jgi:hypothetical protein
VGETVGEIFALILSEPPPSVRQYRADVPEGLGGVIARCLERRLERRVQDVGELAMKLVAFGLPGGKGSLERILRWRTAHEAAPACGGTQTAIAPGVAPTETGPPWLRSGSSDPPLRRGIRWPILALIVGAAGAVAGMGAYGVFGRATMADAPAAAAFAPVSPAAGTRPLTSATENPATVALVPAPAAPEAPIGGQSDARQSIVQRAGPPATTARPTRRVSRPMATHPPAAPTTPTDNEKDLY